MCYHNNFLEPAYTGDNSWIGIHQSEQTKNISLSFNLFIDVSWRWTKGFRAEHAKWYYRIWMKINSININIEKLTSRRLNHNTSQHEINTKYKYSKLKTDLTVSIKISKRQNILKTNYSMSRTQSMIVANWGLGSLAWLSPIFTFRSMNPSYPYSFWCRVGKTAWLGAINSMFAYNKKKHRKLTGYLFPLTTLYIQFIKKNHPYGLDYNI